MPPDQSSVPADVALRLTLAVERILPEWQRVTDRLAAAETALAALKPAADAHTAYLARLSDEETRQAATAVAKRRTAEDDAATAKATEEATKAKARTTAMEWVARLMIPLLTAALGGGAAAWYTRPAQDAPQHQEITP